VKVRWRFIAVQINKVSEGFAIALRIVRLDANFLALTNAPNTEDN
jgi:hypothetical protein